MKQALATRSRFARVRCLLVEDSEFDQRLVDRVLDELGVARLDIANTVQEARAHLLQHRPDLILLDNNLPDGTGINFVQEIREYPALRNIPVVILSDWPTPFMFCKAREAQVKRVMRKDQLNLVTGAEMLSFARCVPAATTP